MEKTKKKILQITLGGKNFTGIVSYLYQYYKHIDREKIIFDFLFCRENSMEMIMNDPVFTGSNFFELFAIKANSNSNDYMKIITGLRRVLKREKYDAIVVNSSVITVIVACIIANLPHRCPIFIAHAHNSSIVPEAGSFRRNWSVLVNFADNIFRLLVRNYSSFLFACTESAGKYTFGNSAIEKSKFQIIPNAISIEDFGYSLEVRNRTRKTLGVESETTIFGTVGQLINKKNLQFAIEIFSEIQAKDKNSELWIIGEGPERGNLENKVEQANLGNKVRFLGQRDDINELLQAMDCFLFVSISEGLGIVAIEAQATGLLTFISDGVPRDVLVTDVAYQIPLSKGPTYWADRILIEMNDLEIRRARSREIRAAGYDIDHEIDWMTKFYSELS